jgi:hypothetical protein
MSSAVCGTVSRHCIAGGLRHGVLAVFSSGDTGPG